MLVYEKKVNGVRRLFGTTANVPADNDAQLTYKDIDGDTLTMVDGDSYVDATFENTSGTKFRGIKRISDDKMVAAFIGNATEAIVPKGWSTQTKTTLSSISVTKKPTKLSYIKNETFDTAGMVVKATYTSGVKDTVTPTSVSPANGATLSTAGTQTVTVTYTEGSVTKTDTFTITVTNA